MSKAEGGEAGEPVSHTHRLAVSTAAGSVTHPRDGRSAADIVTIVVADHTAGRIGNRTNTGLNSGKGRQRSSPRTGNRGGPWGSNTRKLPRNQSVSRRPLGGGLPG